MEIKIDGDLEKRFKAIMDHEGAEDPLEIMDSMMMVIESMIDGSMHPMGPEAYKDYERAIAKRIVY